RDGAVRRIVGQILPPKAQVLGGELHAVGPLETPPQVEGDAPAVLGELPRPEDAGDVLRVVPVPADPGVVQDHFENAGVRVVVERPPRPPVLPDLLDGLDHDDVLGDGQPLFHGRQQALLDQGPQHGRLVVLGRGERRDHEEKRHEGCSHQTPRSHAHGILLFRSKIPQAARRRKTPSFPMSTRIVETPGKRGRRSRLTSPPRRVQAEPCPSYPAALAPPSRTGATVARRTSLGSSKILPLPFHEPPSRSASMTVSATALPRRCRGWWTVVSGGCASAASRMSSKPMIDTSSGTRSPCARTASMAPSAIRSEAQNTAVGRGSSARSRSMLRLPLARLKSPSTIHSSRTGQPASAIAFMYPSRRSWLTGACQCPLI